LYCTIAVLLLTLGLAIFDSENTVVKTIAGAAGVISFFIAFPNSYSAGVETGFRVV